MIIDNACDSSCFEICFNQVCQDHKHNVDALNGTDETLMCTEVCLSRNTLFSLNKHVYYVVIVLPNVIRNMFESESFALVIKAVSFIYVK